MIALFDERSIPTPKSDKVFFGDLHGHRQRPLFRVGTCQRHPCDVERMREGTKDLSPHDAKVPYASEIWAKRSECAVENVADQVARETGHDGLATFVADV